MVEQRTSGLWKWLIILLVLCNFALIGTIWLKPNGMPPPPKPISEMDQMLKLSKEQEAKMKEMRSQSHKTVDSLKKEARSAREAFFAGIKTGKSSPAQQDSLATRLGLLHKMIELETYRNFSAIKEILTDKQKPIFDSLLMDVLRSMPEQPRGRGDGPPPGGHPPRHHGDKGDGPPPQPRDDDHPHHPGDDGDGPPEH